MVESDLFRSLVERLQGSAAVRSVFGEPISASGKTIIPVAKIALGFGGGSGKSHEPAAREGGEGVGAGGGARATPMGVFEVTETGTRFVPVRQTRALLGGLAVGLLLGAWMGRRHRHG
jgi:uncharacterized spore protein YtfJ